jgi:hypothetical protein
MPRTLNLAFSSLALAAALLTPARAQIYHQFVPLEGDCPSAVWYAPGDRGAPAAGGHSGMLALGMEAYASTGFPPALWGGWFSWTGEGAYLSYAGGTISTTDILSPSGAALNDVRGAVYLASGLDVLVVAATGDIFAVTLYSGVLFWTPSHVYLLLVGGVPTVYEVTAPGGGPIAGVRGIARLAAQVIDHDPLPTVTNAILWSGALIYTDTQVFLTRTHTTISTTEVTDAGHSIDGVRGVLSMGGIADPIQLAAAAYIWTKDELLLHATNPSATTEILGPTGAPLADVWGMVRHGRPWDGTGTFTGAASLFAPEHQYFMTTLGPVGLREVLTGTAAAIRSDVRVVANNSMLRQASGSLEVAAVRTTSTGSQRGTVVGLGQ